MKLFFLKPKDQIKIGENIECPFEKLPYKKLFGNLFIKSTCHIHKNRLHMFHHKLFCFLLCKHYKFMIKKFKEYQSKQKCHFSTYFPSTKNQKE